MRFRPSSDFIMLLFFVILKFVLQYVLIHPAFDLHRDEYLHLDQANHLAWGYESVPPFTSWISYIILLFGNHQWLIKFFPALYGCLTIIIVWKITHALQGGLFAKVLGAMAITFSAILRINILYQPNSFDILSWTAVYGSVIAYVLYERPRWLYAAAVCFALGFLNKYNIIFLLVGLLPAMLLTAHRKLFLNKHLYGAIMLAAVMIAPNLFWQYQNNFPVVRHMKALQESQLVHVDRFDFLKEQMLFFVSSLYILIAALLSFFMHKPYSKFRFLAYAFFITFLTFVYLKAKSYYAIGLYPILFSFGCIYLEQLLQRKPIAYLRPVLLAVTFLLGLPLLKIAFPIYHPRQMIEKSDMYNKFGMLRWEDGLNHSLPQDFADMLGWRELAKKVDDAQGMLQDSTLTLILCDNYGQAGAINYYSRKRLKALSFNADYINWFDLGRTYQHIIRIKEFESDDRTIQNHEKDFEKVFVAGSIIDSLAREKGTTIYVFKNAKINIVDSLKHYLRGADPY